MFIQYPAIRLAYYPRGNICGKNLRVRPDKQDFQLALREGGYSKGQDRYDNRCYGPARKGSSQIEGSESREPSPDDGTSRISPLITDKWIWKVEILFTIWLNGRMGLMFSSSRG